MAAAALAAAGKVSRAAVAAAAKAAGIDLRKATPSQYRTLCAAAAAEVTPTGSGLAAAGIGAKGTGAGLAADGLGTKRAAGGAGAGLAADGLGTKRAAGGAGAGLAADGLGAKRAAGGAGAGLAADGLGTKGTGAPGAGLATPGLGFPVGDYHRTAVSLYRAKVAGGGLVAAGSGAAGIRAGMCTSTPATRDGCGQCSKLEHEVESLRRLCERHSVDLWGKNFDLRKALADLQKEMSNIKSDNMRNTMGIMASGIGIFLAIGAFFGPDVQKAWKGETLAEMDLRAAARRPGGAADKNGGAAAPPGNAPPKATANATTTATNKK